jgi:MoaA/NifB/PqqE/SkfB family radical SAM enzyme
LDEEMSTTQVKHIIDGLAKLNVLVNTFTGGEPTLRSDLPELVSYAHHKKILVGIATNGYYVYDMLKEGKLKDAEWIMVSLDWPTAPNHNKYRNLDVFDRALKGIRAGVLQRKQMLVSCVVTNDNMHCMEDMCILTRKIGAMLELLPCEDIIREQNDTEHYIDDIQKFIPNLHTYANEIRRLRSIYPNLITDNVTASIIEAGGFGYQNLLHCISARAYINIRYNGEMVFPCKIHPILKVNVLNKSVYDVYYSKEAKEIMDKRDSFAFCKGCRLGCAIVTTIPSRVDTLYEKYVKAFINGNLF